MKDYDYNDAITFIGQRCDVNISDIEKVLELELEYMRSIGLIVDDPQEELSWDEQDALRNIECQLNDEHHLYIASMHNDCEMRIVETAIKEFKENRGIK